MIKNKLTRIAKDYFCILKKKEVQILSNEINNVYNDLRNTNLISTFINNQTENIQINAKKFNQYYTTNYNILLCIQLYTYYTKIDKDQDIIIEPSAGCGSFISAIQSLCNNTLFIDIDPKHNSIKKSDFLKFEENLNKYKEVHIIGNPPFNNVTKFIKKACKIATKIGFILPLSFCKESRKKRFPLNFHCTQEHVLLNDKFLFCNKLHKVPTVFQI